MAGTGNNQGSLTNLTSFAFCECNHTIKMHKQVVVVSDNNKSVEGNFGECENPVCHCPSFKEDTKWKQGTGSSSTSYTSYKDKCVCTKRIDKGDPAAVTYGPTTDPLLIYGYKKDRILSWFDPTKVLTINLTGVSVQGYNPSDPIKKIPERLNWIKLNPPLIPTADELLLDMPDRGILLLKASFWPDLLKECYATNYRRIEVCCVGGHGRTGTVLACLLLASGNFIKGFDGKAAVKSIRDFYCPEAIESETQENYIGFVGRQLAKSGKDS